MDLGDAIVRRRLDQFQLHGAGEYDQRIALRLFERGGADFLDYAGGWCGLLQLYPLICVAVLLVRVRQRQFHAKHGFHMFLERDTGCQLEWCQRLDHVLVPDIWNGFEHHYLQRGTEHGVRFTISVAGPCWPIPYRDSEWLLRLCDLPEYAECCRERREQ